MSKITAEDFELKNWPRLAYLVFSSYFLAMWVLVFMTIVTLFGTLYQVDYGLFAAKQKYFHSWFLMHTLGDGFPMLDSMRWADSVRFPLPGGLLLMTLLVINLVIGALVKVKKRARGVGMLIAHFGMIFLLVSGFVTFKYNREGYMALYEGQASNRVESYREWQLEIMALDESGKAESALVIPPQDLQTISRGEERVFQSADLPFDVVLSDYTINAVPVPVSAPIAGQAEGKEIDGYKLLVQKSAKEAEQNMPAVIASFRSKSTTVPPVETIISARSSNFDPREQPMAFGFEIEGSQFAARMVKHNWAVPFDVKLDKFIFERHPGVSMARNYESRITRIEGETEKAVPIKMNEPMRYQGFTFFQESFGPANAGPGDAMYSQFAVHNNPADQWPLYALIINGIGLGIHFLIKLFGHTTRHLKTTPAKPAEGEGSPASA